MSALALLDQLPLEQVTPEHIYNALNERREMLQNGGVSMEPQDFFTPEDLATYAQAAAWWPKDVPLDYSLPTLRELCLYIWLTSGSVLPFRNVLSLLAQKCVDYLQLQGKDPTRPNETSAERQRRRAREGMQRHRALKREAADNPAADRVKALYARYIDACRARKDALAAVHDEHDPIVKATMDEWHAAKAELTSAGQPSQTGPQEE